jgi:hypothetical protein
MSEEALSVLQAVEAVKKGAKKARKGDFYDSIQPTVANTNSQRRLQDLYEDEDALKPDDPFQDHKRVPVLIREDLNYRQDIRYPKKPKEADLALIEYLEKLVGRIFYYYKTNYDLQNKIVSDIIIQCNFVPFSPMRRYTIPSGIPVIVPRWVILYLKQTCQNNIWQFEKRSKEEVERDMRSNAPLVEESRLVLRQGEALIKIVDLPEEPTSYTTQVI